MSISQLYLICGFLGADKTTFSKELARETDAQYFNTDEWVAKLFPQSEYENNREQWFEIATNTIWNELKLCQQMAIMQYLMQVFGRTPNATMPSSAAYAAPQNL